MKEQASNQATKLLAVIQDHYAKQRAMPSFAEVARQVASSVSTVAFHINTLKARGYLAATDTGRLIPGKARTFLLTVKGESMVDAGLMPGDTVVVKRGALAHPGDIVVVDANGEGTIKELAQDASGEFYLRARNAAFPDIVPAEGFEVMGVVVGQFRRYSSSRPPARAKSAVSLKCVSKFSKTPDT